MIFIRKIGRGVIDGEACHETHAVAGGFGIHIQEKGPDQI